jgi:hypothetical protein
MGTRESRGIFCYILVKGAVSVLARAIENNFSTPRIARAKKIFSPTRVRKLNVFRRRRAFSRRHRQAFPPRGKNPFDITASGYKIGDSANRSSCFASFGAARRRAGRGSTR